MALEGMDDIQRNLAAMVQRMHKQASAAADETAMYLENYAKAHHGTHPRAAGWVYPGGGVKRWREGGIGWGDVTGNLQSSTHGTAAPTVNGYRIVLSAGMEYAPYVELGHFAKRNTTRMSTRKGKVTAQRISDRSFGTAVQGRAWIWPAVAGNVSTAMDIFRRHLSL